MKLYQYSFNFCNDEFNKIMTSTALTDKEKNCFSYLVKGLNTDEIALKLNCSASTIKNYRRNIYNKIKKMGIPQLAEKELPKITLSIYLLIFPNGKVYIGKATNPKKRWKNGKGYIDNKEMYADIVKYGWESIEKKILYSELSIDEAKIKENETIVLYKSFMPEYGYNTQIISS